MATATPRRRAVRESAHRSRRREELLRLAAAVFAERGYHGASMREIADRWGVRQAAIYYYFPSKAKILEAICRYAITQFVERLAEIRTADLPIEEKVRRALRAHLEPLIEQRFYVHAFLYQRRELPRTARRPLDAQSHAYEALWDAILKEGQRRGVVPKSLERRIAVLAILGMCNTVARWSRAAAELGLDPVAETFTRVISFGLFGESRARLDRTPSVRRSSTPRATAQARNPNARIPAPC
jgi:AcrR family transcriptional regulator